MCVILDDEDATEENKNNLSDPAPSANVKVVLSISFIDFLTS